jgi:hypothetical protein
MRSNVEAWVQCWTSGRNDPAVIDKVGPRLTCITRLHCHHINLVAPSFQHRLQPNPSPGWLAAAAAAAAPQVLDPGVRQVGAQGAGR